MRFGTLVLLGDGAAEDPQVCTDGRLSWRNQLETGRNDLAEKLAETWTSNQVRGPFSRESRSAQIWHSQKT